MRQTADDALPGEASDPGEKRRLRVLLTVVKILALLLCAAGACHGARGIVAGSIGGEIALCGAWAWLVLTDRAFPIGRDGRIPE